MINKFSKNPDEEDAKTILQNLSIKTYMRNFIDRADEMLHCVQIIRPENLKHLPRRY